MDILDFSKLSKMSFSEFKDILVKMIKSVNFDLRYREVFGEAIGKTAGSVRRKVSILSNWEQNFFNKLLPHIPAFISSDMLTALGVLGGFTTLAGYYLSNFDARYLFLAAFGYVLNWVGDSLDGQLARYRKNERPLYGYFIDHSLDAFVDFIIGLGLGLSPYIDLPVGLLFTIGYFFFFQIYHLTCYIENVSNITYLKLGPTEMRILAILFTISMYFVKDPMIQTKWGNFSIYNIIMVVFFVLMTMSFLFIIYIKAKEYLKIDLENRVKNGKK